MTEITFKNQEFAALARVLLSLDDSYRDDTRYWVRFLAIRNLNISIESLDAYEQYLVRKGYAAATINKRLIAVKRRIRYLFEHSDESFDLVKKMQLDTVLNKIKLRKIKEKSVKIITPKEFDTLKQYANVKMKLVIEFLWSTGCRISEMINIRLKNITLENSSAIIRIMGKGRKERFIKVSRDLLQAIRETFAGKKYLFETKHGNRYGRNYLSDMIKKYGRIYLGKNISAHTLRHSFATEKIAKTNKIKAVSRYLGHASTSTTLNLYVHQELSDEELGL